MAIIQSLINIYRPVLLATTVSQMNVLHKTHLHPTDFIITDLSQDSSTGTSRLVIDAHIPNVQRIRVYLYWDGVHGNSQLYYERVYGNNIPSTVPLITHVVRISDKVASQIINALEDIIYLSARYAEQPDCVQVDSCGNPRTDAAGHFILVGCVDPDPPVDITVYIWNDVNQDGVCVNTENLVVPSPITITVSQASTGASVTSSTYTGTSPVVMSVLPGAYTIQVTAVTGYIPTIVNGSSTGNSLTSTLTTGVIAVAPATPMDIYLGFVEVPHTGSISAYVWEDTELNGELDPTEPLLPGVQVDVLNTADAIVQTANTDSNGEVLFNSLPVGTYRLSVTVPDGYTSTTHSTLATGNKLLYTGLTSSITVSEDVVTPANIGIRQQVTGVYNGSVQVNDDIYMLPADITSEVVQVTFNPDDSYYTSELPDTFGYAIHNACISPRDTIISILNGALWEFDPDTKAVTVTPDATVSQPDGILYNVSSNTVIAYRALGNLYGTLERTVVSLTVGGLVTTVTSISGFSGRIHDSTLADNNTALLATSSGLYKCSISNPSSVILLYNKPVYTVIMLANGHILITTAVAKSLTPDVVAIEMDVGGTIVQTIDLPDDVYINSPPIPDAIGNCVYYGSNSTPYASIYKVTL